MADYSIEDKEEMIKAARKALGYFNNRRLVKALAEMAVSSSAKYTANLTDNKAQPVYQAVRENGVTTISIY